MTELERTLTRLGRELAWPETPDLASAVATRLASRRPTRFGLGRRAVAVGLAVVAVALAGVLAVPSARTAVLEWLGLRSVRIERVAQLPATPARGRLELGERMRLAAARAQAGHAVLLPDRDGFRRPDSVWLDNALPGYPVSLVYGRVTRPRLLLTQFAGGLLIEKSLGPRTTAEVVLVNGRRGIWIEGRPHRVLYESGGDVVEDSPRLAGNTLLWERGALTLRLEGELAREEAIGIAEAIR